MADPSSISRLVRTRGAELQLIDAGPPGATAAVLFLHYWGGSAATWRKVIERLQPEVRCLSVSQRGWGGSRSMDGRYDLEAMADDVEDVIAALGVTRVLLVGHSMGGKVAQILAHRRLPELAGLLLVAPAPPTPMPVPAEARARMLASYKSAEGVARALKMLAGPTLTSEDAATVLRDTLAGDDGAKREWTERGMTADLQLVPDDLDLPLMLLVGSEDQVERPDRLQSIYQTLAPHAVVHEVAGAGHLLPLEAPRALAASCQTLLGTLSRRQPDA